MLPAMLDGAEFDGKVRAEIEAMYCSEESRPS